MPSPSFYQIRQCENIACGLRYPLTEAHPFGERCPLCLGVTQLVLQRPLTADQRFRPQARAGQPIIEALLDNVRSAWNVGAIFRTADAFGINKLHLCGITPTPENPSVAKTALGADKSVGWTASKNAVVTAQALKAMGARLWALEQDEKAFSIYDIVPAGYLRFSIDQSPISQLPNFPIILIVGNEVTGVDMAKLKYEFKNEYHKTHLRPLRDYLFGYFHIVAALMAPFAPLANFGMQNPLLKALAARLFQIAPQRPFPTFSRWQAQPRNTGIRPQVIFFPDPFTHYVEPQVEQAAFDLLDAAGFDVLILSVVSSGASLLSKGMIAPARGHAAAVLDALARLDPDAALPVVGIEPPEIYSLKNDYASLWPARREEIARRAAKTWLLEEFIVRTDAFSRWRERNLPVAGTLKFQPHCHQRAEAPAADGLPNGPAATVALLRVCGYSVDVLDTGCCGMAGTFGYDAEHYELSMQVGALKLFPQVRAATDAQIVSTGAACRMQVEQGTGVATQHPLLLVAETIMRNS